MHAPCNLVLGEKQCLRAVASPFRGAKGLKRLKILPRITSEAVFGWLFVPRSAYKSRLDLAKGALRSARQALRALRGLFRLLRHRERPDGRPEAVGALPAAVQQRCGALRQWSEAPARRARAVAAGPCAALGLLGRGAEGGAPGGAPHGAAAQGAGPQGAALRAGGGGHVAAAGRQGDGARTVWHPGCGAALGLSDAWLGLISLGS